MNEEKVFEILRDIDDKYIAEAKRPVQKKKQRWWAKWTITAACICCIVGVATLLPGNDAGVSSETPTLEGSVKEAGEEKQDIKPGQTNEDAKSNINGKEEQPVQNETAVVKSLDSVWGGSYLDDSGKWVVWLTENTNEYQKMVFERNPNLIETSVIFKNAEYSLVYLDELLSIINDEMQNGKLPFVSSAMVSEQTNRVDVYLNEHSVDDENKIRSYDTEGGAISIKYSDDSGVEDLGHN